MTNFDLPHETVEFLQSGKQLAYDPARCMAGPIRLRRMDELTLDEVYVDSEQSPIEEEDPHAGEEGYYLVQSVDLVESQRFGPGVLLWLPQYRLFGQYDGDHWDVVVFPGTSWSDIVSHPERYLGAMWAEDLHGGAVPEAMGPMPFSAGAATLSQRDSSTTTPCTERECSACAAHRGCSSRR